VEWRIVVGLAVVKLDCWLNCFTDAVGATSPTRATIATIVALRTRRLRILTFLAALAFTNSLDDQHVSGDGTGQ